MRECRSRCGNATVSLTLTVGGIYSEAGSARGCRTHLRRIHAEAQMREPRLAERHESRIEVSPNEQQEEGHGSVIFIEDGIDHRKREVKSQGHFKIRHPPRLVLIFLGGKRAGLAFNLEFRRACKFRFLADDGFDNGLRLSPADPPTPCPHERHIQKTYQPRFWGPPFPPGGIKTG